MSAATATRNGLESSNLAREVQEALAWQPSAEAGQEFALGRLSTDAFVEWLFSPQRLFDLLASCPLAPPQLRVVRSGGDLDSRSFMAWRPQRPARADTSKLSRLLNEGATLVLNFANELDTRLAYACRSLQWWTGETVQVNAYLTTGPTSGFDLHWDDHDVIVVQIAGTKDWDVRCMAGRYPMPGDAEHNPTSPEDSIWQGTLESRDVLYLPRGQWHVAGRNDDGFSLHLTFAIPRLTGVDWLAWIGHQARDIEAFRADMPRDPAAAAAHGQRLKKAIPELVARWEPHRFPEQRPVPVAGQGAMFVRRMSPSVPYVACVTDMPPRVTNVPEAGTVEVKAGSARITLKAAAEPALDELLSGLPVDVERLSDELGLDLEPLACSLIENGICTPITSEFYAELARL